MSAFTLPRLRRMSHSARDQIWPSCGPRRSGRPGSACRGRRGAGSAARSRCTRWRPSRRRTAADERRHAEPLRDHVGDGHGPVVAEALADRTRLLRGERGPWAKWIAWPYSWRITSASSASSTPPLPKRSSFFGWSVANELSRPHWLIRTACGSVVDRAPGLAEAEAVDVALRLGDPVVGHHLLELVLVARVAERVRLRVRRVPGLADDVRVVAAQEPAAVEVRQRHVWYAGCNGRVGVRLVGQRLVRRGDRVREEAPQPCPCCSPTAASRRRLPSEHDRPMLRQT